MENGGRTQNQVYCAKTMAKWGLAGTVILLIQLSTTPVLGQGQRSSHLSFSINLSEKLHFILNTAHPLLPYLIVINKFAASAESATATVRADTTPCAI